MASNESLLVGLGIFFLVFTTLFVLLRLYARYISDAKFWWDDVLIVLALLFTMAIDVSDIVGAKYGQLGKHTQFDMMGRPIFDNESVVYSICLWISVWVTVLQSGFTKLSILCFYLRIFSDKKFRMVAFGVVILISAWTVAYFLPMLLQCFPVEQAWGPYWERTSCISFPMLVDSFAISDLLTDVLIILMPIPMIWSLQMPTGRKVAVSSIFLLGSFVIVAGIVRVVVFYQMTQNVGQTLDIPFYAATSAYWNLAQSSIAVVCACLPTLSGLVRGERSKKIRKQVWQWVGDKSGLNTSHNSSGSSNSKASTSTSTSTKPSEHNRKHWSHKMSQITYADVDSDVEAQPPIPPPKDSHVNDRHVRCPTSRYSKTSSHPYSRTSTDNYSRMQTDSSYLPSPLESHLLPRNLEDEADWQAFLKHNHI